MIDAMADGAPVEPLARYFEFWLLRLQGVYPQLSSCPACGGPFDGGALMPARDHHYVCRRCAAGGGTSISLEALHFLRSASATAPESLHDVTLEPGAGARARNGPRPADRVAPRKGSAIGAGPAAHEIDRRPLRSLRPSVYNCQIA